MAKTKLFAVRILAACVIADMALNPDDVVELPEGLAKAHAAAGECDPHPDAVAYCVDVLKKPVLKLGSVPEAPAEAGAPDAQAPESAQLT